MNRGNLPEGPGAGARSTQVDGVRLHLESAPAHCPGESGQEIQAHKAELLEALGKPRETAYAVWAETVRDIGELERAILTAAGRSVDR